MPIAPGRVLYVGEASQSLRTRLATYLIGDQSPRARPKKKETHKGKGFVLQARDTSGDHGVYLSWAEYGGDEHGIHILEASLIHYLDPGANDRDELTRHPKLADHKRLNPGLIR